MTFLRNSLCLAARSGSRRRVEVRFRVSVAGEEAGGEEGGADLKRKQEGGAG